MTFSGPKRCQRARGFCKFPPILWACTRGAARDMCAFAHLPLPRSPLLSALFCSVPLFLFVPALFFGEMRCKTHCKPSLVICLRFYLLLFYLSLCLSSFQLLTYLNETRSWPFHKSRDYCRSLGLKTIREWHIWVKSADRPKEVPAYPERVYAKRGFKGMHDWLGTNSFICGESPTYWVCARGGVQRSGDGCVRARTPSFVPLAFATCFALLCPTLRSCIITFSLSVLFASHVAWA